MRKNKIWPLLAASLLFITGCGEEEHLAVFHDQVDSFYDSLSTVVSQLENIDPDSETAVDDLLGDMDNMAVIFSQLAEIEVPEEFENIDEWADDAANYMAEADRLYHDAYADGGYDENIAAAAAENYTRAMKRINYIAIVMQGRVPEDDNIVILSEPDEPDWNGGEKITEPESSNDQDGS